jgi:hypothetical protein
MSAAEDPARVDFKAILAAIVPADVRDALDQPPSCLSGCGTLVGAVGDLCRPCANKRAQGEHEAAVMRAWRTVPASLRWIRLHAPADDPRRIEDWVSDRAALEHVRRLRVADLRGVSFIGPARSGKTTLMVALFREYLRLGWPADAPIADKQRARRAHFAVGPDLVDAKLNAHKGDHVPAIHVAFNASVLAIDEIARPDPTGVTFRIVHERHREGRVLLATVPYASEKECALQTGDAGLARRLYSKREIEVVEVAA